VSNPSFNNHSDLLFWYFLNIENVPITQNFSPVLRSATKGRGGSKVLMVIVQTSDHNDYSCQLLYKTAVGMRRKPQRASKIQKNKNTAEAEKIKTTKRRQPNCNWFCCIISTALSCRQLHEIYWRCAVLYCHRFFSRFLFDLLGGIAAVIQRHRGNFAKRKT